MNLLIESIRLPVRHTIVLLLIVIGFGSLHSQPEQSIRAVLDSQASAWNRGDLDGYMQGYWKSDSLLFTSVGKIQRGYNATLEKYRKSYGTREKMGALKFSDLEISLLSPDAAWVFGHWELRRKGDHPGGTFTLILRKFPDGWKIVHDHTSVATSQK